MLVSAFACSLATQLAFQFRQMSVTEKAKANEHIITSHDDENSKQLNVIFILAEKLVNI